MRRPTPNVTAIARPPSTSCRTPERTTGHHPPGHQRDRGQWSGHVDLGDLGVADRWADLAIATWSTKWNYGPGREQVLLDAYGIKPDAERTHYYRLLWQLG
jgi:kanamycin kinase